MATSPVLYVYYPPANDDSYPGVPARHITEADWARFSLSQRRTVENATTQEGYTRRKVWVHRDLVDETEQERAQREAEEAAARAEYDRKNSLVRYGQIEAMIDQLEVLPPAEEFATLRDEVAAVADVPPRVEAVEQTAARIDDRALDVRAEGAKGDGATPYDAETAAFQRAVDKANGRWIVVPPGIYDLGQINVTGTARIRLEEGAVLRKRSGPHSEPLINFTGNELIIRGPGVIDGNRHNNRNLTTGVYGRPAMVSGDCEEGKVIDIEGVHFRSIMQGVRLNRFGGYLNFSRNRITDHGQHQQSSGATATIVFINSGQIDATSPLIRTNFNTAIFTDPVDAPGTAPGGFFVCTSDQPTTPLEQGNTAKWEAIGNYFYGYGQNYSTNEIGCLHSYPSPAQCRFIGNHFEHFPVTPVSAKSVTDFVCIGNTFLNGQTVSSYVPIAGAVLYAPGYHAGSLQRSRAVIANNIIDNPGGTTSQGAAGISVNSTPESPAPDVVISGNVIASRGYGMFLSYLKNAHIADNIIRILPEPSSVKRGMDFFNMVGDVEVVDNLIEAELQGIVAVSSTNKDGRLWVKGNTVKSAGSFCMDLRGLALAVITGNTVQRTGGSTAINVTTDGTNPTGKLIYDRTNVLLEGTANLVHASITEFEGQEPLSGTPTTAVGAAAGTGATHSISGDGDKGALTLTTGTSPATGDVLTVTFARARRAAPVVTISPANAAAAAARAYVSATTTTGFTVTVSDAALAASTPHIWRYRVD